MNRGEVWWINFEPSVGGEVQKQRPAVVISNDQANRFANRLQVVPLTTKIARLHPGDTYVMLDGNQRKAMASQLTTVSKLRVLNFVGRISREDLQKVEQAIKLQLGLTP